MGRFWKRGGLDIRQLAGNNLWTVHTFSEIDGYPLRPGFKAATDIFLALLRSASVTALQTVFNTHLVDQILDKLLPRLPLNRPIQRIKQIQHTRRNNRSLHLLPSPLCIPHALLEIVICIRFIFQWSACQSWQLAVVAIVEDCLTPTSACLRIREERRTKYCPSAAKLLANPFPPSVSMIGYVAKEEARCSPSVKSVSPVSAILCTESSAALS